MFLKDWTEGWRNRRRQLAAIHALDPRCFTDLGVTADELRKFVGFPADLRDRMRRMAEVFGADVRRLEQQRALHAEALNECGQCRARDACRRELDAPGGTTAARCGFCPNADIWHALAR